MLIAILVFQIITTLLLALQMLPEPKRELNDLLHLVEGLSDDLLALTAKIHRLTPFLEKEQAVAGAASVKPPTTGPSGHSFHGHPTVHHDR